MYYSITNFINHKNSHFLEFMASAISCTFQMALSETQNKGFTVFRTIGKFFHNDLTDLPE